MPSKIEIRTVQVLGSHMSYRVSGNGPNIVFLHGNPTSSFVWRDVIPQLAQHARCVAPDLIGMGDSGKPDISYRFEDHARYLDELITAAGIEDAVLVGYDWGGALAFDWAARHPKRIRGLIAFETFLRPLQWSEWPPQGAELFRAIRTPGVGERMVLEENQFLARSLENGVKRSLSTEERAAYYAPYPDPRSRRPLLQWPREIPVDGQPADVVAIVERYDAWLATSHDVPKLILDFQTATPLGSRDLMDWARMHIAALDVVALGPAGHHAPEDASQEIGGAIRTWLKQKRLLG